MDKENKDFLLALYNKLWENINNKDSRLWTFLSLYGAAVALAFGAGKLANLELYALLVILVLTLWALLIIVNADWWDHRNRLMVAGIEAKFPEALQGVLPVGYQGVRVVVMDRLNQASVGLLVLAASVIYLHTMWPYLVDNAVASWDVLLPLCLLFAFVGCACWLWLIQVERTIHDYYITARGLRQAVPPADLAAARAIVASTEQAAARHPEPQQAGQRVADAALGAVAQAVQQGTAPVAGTPPTPQQAAQTAADAVAAAAGQAAQPAAQSPVVTAVVQAAAQEAAAQPAGQQPAAQEVAQAAERAATGQDTARAEVAQVAHQAVAQAAQQGVAHVAGTPPTPQQAAQTAADAVAAAAGQAAARQAAARQAAQAVALAASQALQALDQTELEAKELEARNKTHWRVYALVVLAFASLMFDAVCWRNARTALWPLLVGAVAQLVAFLVFITLARSYYRAGQNQLSHFTLRVFYDPTAGKPSWNVQGRPLTIAALFLSSVVLGGLTVCLSRPDLALRGGETAAVDLKTEREALLEKWDRLQKRSWEMEAVERKKELSEYLKTDEARQRFITRADLDEAVQKALQSPKKGP